MAGLDNQPVDTDSSQTSGLTYRFQGSMNVHHGTRISATVTAASAQVFFCILHRLITSYNKIKCIINVQTK